MATKGITPVYDLSVLPGYGRSLLHPPHIGHRNHLCDIAERGEMTLEQVKALVRDPKYVCETCGRAAAKAENLCDPVPL